MSRIAAIVALLLGTAVPALAQDQRQPPLVVLLRVNTADSVEPGATFFRNAMSSRGWIDGKNVRLESRLAEGHVERLPAMARSLLGDHPAVIVPFGEAATRAAQAATSTVPIVTLSDDLVESGFVATLAKPGGNITGVSILATELDAKKIDLLKEMFPLARRFGVLRDPGTSVPARMNAIGETARALGIELETVDVHDPADISPAFSRLSSAGIEAVDILASPLLFSLRDRIAQLSIADRLPAICQFREMAKAGCLASYGISLPRAFAALDDVIDKVLKGARPAETPAQQPTAFELVINLGAARSLGVGIPQSILARADEVIE